MTPVSISKKDNISHFHYKFGDLRLFVEASYNGTSGSLLIARDERMDYYVSTGTLEKPMPVKRMKDCFKISFKVNSIFGKRPTDEEILNPKPFVLFKDYGYYIPLNP